MSHYVAVFCYNFCYRSVCSVLNYNAISRIFFDLGFLAKLKVAQIRPESDEEPLPFIFINFCLLITMMDVFEDHSVSIYIYDISKGFAKAMSAMLLGESTFLFVWGGGILLKLHDLNSDIDILYLK